MKKLMLIIIILTSINTFSGVGQRAELRKCKADVAELRPLYAHDQAFGDWYLLRPYIGPLRYWANKNFLYRPWLSELKTSEKLKVCKELLEGLQIYVVEPIGVNATNRGIVIQPEFERNIPLEVGTQENSSSPK